MTKERALIRLMDELEHEREFKRYSRELTAEDKSELAAVFAKASPTYTLMELIMLAHEGSHDYKTAAAVYARDSSYDDYNVYLLERLLRKTQDFEAKLARQDNLMALIGKEHSHWRDGYRAELASTLIEESTIYELRQSFYGRLRHPKLQLQELVGLFHMEEVAFEEFDGSFSPNSQKHCIMAEGLFSNGETATLCMEGDLSSMLRKLFKL